MVKGGWELGGGGGGLRRECMLNITVNLGAGIACWLERRTRDRNVASSNTCRSGGIIFFSRVNFFFLTLI